MILEETMNDTMLELCDKQDECLTRCESLIPSIIDEIEKFKEFADNKVVLDKTAYDRVITLCCIVSNEVEKAQKCSKKMWEINKNKET